ncbi:hypothetical protein ACTFIW_003807 [Dictyostelium discoideum]
MVNNQGLLVEEELFNFPSNFQVNVAPFGTPEGISVSSTVKNNDTDFSNVDVELISYLAQSAIVLAVNAQTSLSRVRHNNIAKEIYGSEVLLPIKIKDTPKIQTTIVKIELSFQVPNFCQEVVNGLKFHLLPNFKPMPNPIPFSIPEGPKSDCITKEVQDLLLDDAIEKVLPNRYSKRVFYSNVFTVPKPGTTLHRPVLNL